MRFLPKKFAGLAWSERNFRRLLASERDLADRHAIPCTLIVLDTGNASKSERKSLLRHFKLRLRVSDSVGQFQGDLAVLLRNTTQEASRPLIEDLGTWLSLEGIEVSHQLMEYPESETGSATELRLLSAPDIHRPRPLGPGPDRVALSKFEIALVEEPSFGRRSLDVIVSLGALIAISPILVAVAVAVRVDSNGPCLYRQRRVGTGGRTFNILKFRSMHINAEERQAELESANEKDGPIFKIKNDPRVTRIGHFIRRYSLDELPQLWNVVRGDMTLVGPRPQKADEVEQYEPWQRRRLTLPCGLTCIWQVSGRSNVSFKEWMRMDCDYARRRNFLLDLSLLFRTLPALLTARGAY